MQITHDALNAPMPILRAMYELQMKRTDSFFLEVQKRLASALIHLHLIHLHLYVSLLLFSFFFPFFFSRFDGNEIKTDETIRTLAQKWQLSRRPHSEERNAKAVDTDMIMVSCVVSLKYLPPLRMSPIIVVLCVLIFTILPQSKPSHCEKATEEISVVAQKLISNSESDMQLSYSKQRRTKSSALLHKELDVRSNRTVRQYLVKVNEAIATLYARHVLALLLADWPAEMPMSDEALELSGASHMAYILDMLMQLEEKQHWEKVDSLFMHGKLSAGMKHHM